MDLSCPPRSWRCPGRFGGDVSRSGKGVKGWRYFGERSHYMSLGEEKRGIQNNPPGLLLQKIMWLGRGKTPTLTKYQPQWL